ncbi:DUF2589 domain-containing protein [Pseudoalteromonas sp. SWXJZ94C]|uniref:DUF2589 domain-containing protein n=1 Tax=unclassified Pseudoalteromonas TaxID=194690 RepID=UPI00040AC7BA|nr:MULTISPECIES: DUF2589 domain-containing protein [unclassified Pseudoalteromonas]MBH0057458.1 DUF2589 domain-containing protein [Pseudoalteromonas sp. SWXJZ94C]
MIKFEMLIHELHSSIKQAANEVEAQGIKHINKFFEIVEIPKTNVTDLDDESIQKIKVFIDSNDTESALNILNNHNEKLASNNQVRRVLKPKTMQMAFPDKDHNGPKISYVDVPIITLTPISSTKIQEVIIKAKLEVTANEQNELLVAFPKQTQGGIFSTSHEKSTSNVEIEIKLQGGETPEGLQKLVEGYERSLRAQIPG